MALRPDTIWLDASFLTGRWTGVAYYGAHLLNALAIARTPHALMVFRGVRTYPLVESSDKSASMHQMQTEPRSGPKQPLSIGQMLNSWPSLKAAARSVRGLGLSAAWHRRAGIFHALNFAPPMRVDMPVIPLIHDMSCLVHPDTHPVERVRFFESQVGLFQSAPAIHTVSDFSAGEITRLLGVPSSRLHVIRPGPDPDALACAIDEPTGAAVDTLHRRFALRPDGYMLGVGTLEPRKNLAFLVEAYLNLPIGVQERFPLVLVGASGWGNIQWPNAHDRAVAGGRIRHLGYVTRADLLLLYRHAKLSAYPSVYEGFGLPVVESLCLGTPVLVTAGTACEEAGAGAAFALPCDDLDAWSAAMRERLSAGSTLRDRHDRRTHCTSQPTWHDAALLVSQMYRSVIGTGLHAAP
jgi:glycosyltransferase involved in cell wall biosynthesis